MKHLISCKTGNYTIKKRDLYILEYLRNELNSTKSKIDRYYNEWECVKRLSMIMNMFIIVLIERKIYQV